MQGNSYTLFYFAATDLLQTGGFDNEVNVRLNEGEWAKRVDSARTGGEEPASREEIMMALENVEYLLVK